MPTKRKKNVVKLQNKTNVGLFELDDNIKRSDSKIRSVHRISEAEETELYEQIGYKSRYRKQKEESQPPLRPVQAEDIEEDDIVTTTATNNFTSGKKIKVTDALTDSGIL